MNRPTEAQIEAATRALWGLESPDIAYEQAKTLRTEHYLWAKAYAEAAISAALAVEAGAEPNPMSFFSENVDRWGAAEWFNRLANAIREQDKACVAKDDIAFETYRMIAASSAMTLVRDHEAAVRSALTPASSAVEGEAVADCPAPTHAGEWRLVGEAGTMPGTTGFTMAAFKADDVPLGTRLFVTSPAPQTEDLA